MATSVTRTTVALAWTNPSTTASPASRSAARSDRRRRRRRPTAPPSRDVASPGEHVRRHRPDRRNAVHLRGVRPRRCRTWRRRDLTAHTRSPGTDAVLRVNPLHRERCQRHHQTRRGVRRSDSLAADGTDLASWSWTTATAAPVLVHRARSPVDILNTSHTFTGTGNKTVILTVTDSGGSTDHRRRHVHVFAPHRCRSPSKSTPPRPARAVTFEVTAETPKGTAITS